MSSTSLADAPTFEVTSAQRWATLAVVVLPMMGLVAAIVLLWNRAVTWVDVSLLIAMFLISGFGITMGFHRYFTHRSFETVTPVRVLLAVMGSMAAQGPLVFWTAVHRLHHQHSDSEQDPHSPHGHGRGVWAVLAGFWHAHIGWLFAPKVPDVSRYAHDLVSDRLMNTISNLFPLWVALGLVIPAVVGGLITGTWFGALTGFIWGGLVRLCVGQHITWSINSVCHIWGQRPFISRDESRNNVIFGVFALGEGWHNNHHAFPTSARHGLRWWEFDLTYVMVWLMERVGLAWRVRLPSAESLKARRASQPEGPAAITPPENDSTLPRGASPSASI